MSDKYDEWWAAEDEDDEWQQQQLDDLERLLRENPEESK